MLHYFPWKGQKWWVREDGVWPESRRITKPPLWTRRQLKEMFRKGQGMTYEVNSVFQSFPWLFCTCMSCTYLYTVERAFAHNVAERYWNQNWKFYSDLGCIPDQMCNLGHAISSPWIWFFPPQSLAAEFDDLIPLPSLCLENHYTRPPASPTSARPALLPLMLVYF